MGRMLAIIGVTYALLALFGRSVDPDHWSEAARALMLIIAGSTVLMHIECLLRDWGASGHRRRPAGPRHAADPNPVC